MSNIDEQSALLLRAKNNDEFAKDKFSFVVPEPSMTYFDNMFFFSKERIPRY